MFESTKYALEKIKKDLQILNWIFTYGVHILMAIYYIFALIAQMGNLVVNIILLCVSGIFLLLNSVYGAKKLSRKEKNEKSTVRRVVVILKSLTIAGSLLATIYAMYTANTTVNPISIILTTILIVLWFINVLIELVRFIIELEIDRLLDGIEKDFKWAIEAKEFIDNQAEKTKNFIENATENIKDGFEKTSSKVKAFFNKDKGNEN